MENDGIHNKLMYPPRFKRRTKRVRRTITTREDTRILRRLLPPTHDKENRKSLLTQSYESKPTRIKTQPNRIKTPAFAPEPMKEQSFSYDLLTYRNKVTPRSMLPPLKPVLHRHTRTKSVSVSSRADAREMSFFESRPSSKEITFNAEGFYELACRRVIV